MGAKFNQLNNRISHIQMPNIQSLDLKSLRVFDSLMTERNTVKVAQTLSMSQPSVSHNLNSLRHALGNELFLRTNGGLTPTAYAETIWEPVQTALMLLEDMIRKDEEFNPLLEEHRFKFATADYAANALLPSLLSRIQEEAPLVNINLFPNTGDEIYEMLDRAVIDFAISHHSNDASRFRSERILEDKYVCVMSANHKLANQELTLDNYFSTPQIMVSLSGDTRSNFDKEFARLGRQRRVLLSVNQFSLLPTVLKSTNGIASVASNLIQHFSHPQILSSRSYHSRQSNARSILFGIKGLKILLI